MVPVRALIPSHPRSPFGGFDVLLIPDPGQVLPDWPTTSDPGDLAGLAPAWFSRSRQLHSGTPDTSASHRPLTTEFPPGRGATPYPRFAAGLHFL